MIINKIKNLIYRFSRKLYTLSRDEVNNQMETNGESWLQDNILKIYSHSSNFKKSGSPLIIFDIGANIGDWTKMLLTKVSDTEINKNINIHCFEPAIKTFEKLKENLGNNDNVFLWEWAISDVDGFSEIFVNFSTSGTNSLHKSVGFKGYSEKIQVTTPQKFIDLNNINYVNFVKIDVEGHDFNVLRGLENLLRTSSVDVIQFEYNHRWLFNNRSLLDVFELIKPYNYSLCKLTAKKLLKYKDWHPEIDRFFEGNYVIINEKCLNQVDYLNAEYGKSNELIYFK